MTQSSRSFGRRDAGTQGQRSTETREESRVPTEVTPFGCERPAKSSDDDWVRETSFGTWFIGTKLWRHHVIRAALYDLRRLLPPGTRYPIIVDIGCGRGRALRLLDVLFRPEIVLGLDI